MAVLLHCDSCKKEFPAATIKFMGEIVESPGKIRLHFFCPFCQAARGDNNPNYRYVEENPQMVRYVEYLNQK